MKVLFIKVFSDLEMVSAGKANEVWLFPVKK